MSGGESAVLRVNQLLIGDLATLILRGEQTLTHTRNCNDWWGIPDITARHKIEGSNPHYTMLIMHLMDLVTLAYLLLAYHRREGDVSIGNDSED